MSRHRLTITLRSDILKQVDRLVDGAKIRNRSHAIEVLLQKGVSRGVSRALILAGGQGLKLRPFTYELPKAMLPVAGKPLLEHTIALCRKHELRDLVISIGHLGEKIREHFGDGSRFGVRITYLVQEGGESGTAQLVHAARNELGDAPFLLYYGDVLADLNLTDLIDFHFSSQGVATLALTSVASTADWGVVSLHGARITSFTEKPGAAKTRSHVINAGVAVLQPEIFTTLTPKDGKLEADVFPRLAKEGKLFGYLFEGRWYDVGSPETYEAAVKEWGNGASGG
ncbi:MAG: NTP transferase domain-containing protein [Candidatus Kerfeldbacteria bacterium]|nr:NTP transferase domain-containing protein [Candidatus Kerfeldbacteria bacterium]